MLVGCASPGVPRPPSLNLPRTVSDLSAVRVGPQVILTWTTPDKTTDNLDTKGALVVRVCRNLATSNSSTISSLAPSAPQQPACNQVARLPVKPGASTATDTLPTALTADPASLIEYSVEILNSASRSAGRSVLAYAASGLAPAPVEALHATPIPTGVMLEWNSSTSNVSTFVDLDRIDSTLQTSQSAQAKKADHKAPLQLAGKESPEVHLRTQLSPSQQSAPPPEPSGMIDRTARFGDTYVYSAQRFRTIQLDGHTLFLRSLASTPITITPTDVFPPATPTGLVAIPGQIGPTASQLAIDLSWQPNSEPDLAGYFVYRSTVDTTTPATRLNPAPLPGPAYRDLTALPGQRYSYTVTAVDTSKNESKPSPPIEETLPQP